MNNSFEEIVVKAKIDYYIFKNYFHQGENEYNVHNSLKINENGYMMPGLAFYNLFMDYKIKLVEKMKSGEFILFEIQSDAAKEIEQLVDFYVVERNSKVEVFKRIFPKYLLIVKAVYDFFKNFSEYFEKIDNFFVIKDDVNRLACASFLIFGDLRFDVKYENKFYIGEDIYTVNSNLGVISYSRFSKTHGKGVISNIINEDIALVDVGLLPNSHGSVVYKMNGNLFGIVLPILNIKRLYVPLGFALKIDTIVNIFSGINGTKNMVTKNIPYTSFLEKTVFIVYRYSI